MTSEQKIDLSVGSRKHLLDCVNSYQGLNGDDRKIPFGSALWNGAAELSTKAEQLFQKISKRMSRTTTFSLQLKLMITSSENLPDLTADDAEAAPSIAHNSAF